MRKAFPTAAQRNNQPITSRSNSYLSVEHIVLSDSVDILLVFSLALQQIGLVFVRIFSNAKPERLVESHRLSSTNSTDRGKSASKASSDSNEHQLERSHGMFRERNEQLPFKGNKRGLNEWVCF